LRLDMHRKFQRCSGQGWGWNRTHQIPRCVASDKSVREKGKAPERVAVPLRYRTSDRVLSAETARWTLEMESFVEAAS